MVIHAFISPLLRRFINGTLPISYTTRLYCDINYLGNIPFIPSIHQEPESRFIDCHARTQHIYLTDARSFFLFYFPHIILPLLLYIQDEKGNGIYQANQRMFILFSCLDNDVFVCIHKGNLGIAQAIWDSWKPCIEAFPIGESGITIGCGVEALSWTTEGAAKGHLIKNFAGVFWGAIPSFPFTILNFICIYYLTTHINTINLRWNRLKPVNNIALSNFLLVQFIFMLPLFTVLSCDWARTFSYWTCTSLLAYHYWKDENDRLFSQLNTFSIKLQRFHWLSNPYIYFTVLCSLPIPFCYGPTLYSSNITKILMDIYQIIEPILF